jgi:uncharacterized protein (TIGR03086 family)
VTDLAPAAARLTALLDDLPDTALDAPTPCGVPVAGVLAHLVMLSEAFRAAAAKEPGQGPPPAEPPALPADWRTVLPRRLDALVTAWRDPAASEGETTAGGLAMAGAEAGVVALDELVLHGWDLAAALGRPYTPDAADTAAVLGFTAQMASPEGVPGLFGPAVAVPADAPDFHRALGNAGRDPDWRPGRAD